MIKLFRLLTPYKIWLLVVMFLVFLQSLAELYLPTCMSDIINNGITNRNLNYILKTGGFMLCIAFGGTICSVISGFLSAKIAMGFSKILRSKLFHHVTNFSMYDFDKLGTPSLITRNTNDIIQIQNFTIFMMQTMIIAPFICIGGMIMAIYKDQNLAWFIILVVPILTVTILTIANKALPLFQAIQAKIDNINLVLREGLIGIRVVRTFNRVEDENERFQRANLDLTESLIKVNQLMATLMPLVIFLIDITIIAVLWFGSIQVNVGKTNIGNLFAFLQYVLQILISVAMTTPMFMMLPRAQASATRITEVLSIHPEFKETEYSKNLKQPGENRGCLEFKNVSFSYPKAEVPALKDISFIARPGEVTAIIGGTGSGKSTLVNLILRFYDVNSGSIEIDGVDLREMPHETLRAKIGFVPQQALLFSGSIIDNIRYGNDEITDHEIEHAAKVAQASEFIMNMKEGFHSAISQGGTNVSGGQKQRLAIARAIVRKPKIYIFDDSFSALDFKTDARLRAALRAETANATILIVGQRIATIKEADRIIVLDNGQISGIGTHSELNQTCKVYQEISASQLQ